MARKSKAARAAVGSKGAEKQVYQIVKSSQLEAVVSTKRHDIMDRVIASGPMSVRELADEIGVAPSSLYYHVQHLCSVGLLAEAGMRQTGNKPEQLYVAPSRRMRMFDALQQPRNKTVLRELVASICRQANRDFARGFDASHRRTAGTKRNTRFARLVGRPDAETMAKINAHLDAVAELIADSAGGPGDRVAVTWVTSPLRGKR